MKNRNLPIDNNWRTPDHVYDQLNSEFNFDFDPCPYNTDPITPETDGLLKEWGSVNFVNPPYDRKTKEAFILKGIQETAIIKPSMKGKTSVFLLPVSTSTKIFKDIIEPNADEIRFVKGRIKFQKKDQLGNWYTPKNGGMHDSMIVVFKGK